MPSAISIINLNTYIIKQKLEGEKNLFNIMHRVLFNSF